jgi:hypothetical protein
VGQTAHPLRSTSYTADTHAYALAARRVLGDRWRVDNTQKRRIVFGQATARSIGRTGGAETKTSDSIELERRNKRHGALGGTGRLVACLLAGGASSWLGWVTARRRGGRA